jgi:hypothetical protein
MSFKEVALFAGAAVGLLALGWSIIHYRLERHVALRVTARSEWRSTNGIRVEITNRSRKRSVEIRDVEVLHSAGLLKRRVGVAAGPGLSPHTPWTIEPEKHMDGWIPLSAVDGSLFGPGPPTRDFSKSVKVRVTLAVGRGPTSRRFKVAQQDGT